MHDFQTRRFWEQFLIDGFALFGAWAAVLGTIDVFKPDWISQHPAPWLIIVIASSLGFGLVRAWPQPIQENYTSFKIRIAKGDIFAKGSDAHLMIGMCDTFDTAPPHIIARTSIQGQFLKHIHADDVSRFDHDLDVALAGVTPRETVQKPGKTDRYPLGTIATLSEHERKYFCLAYTEMTGMNEANATVDGIWGCLQRLWVEVRAQSNGGTLWVPVIGQGQARVTPAPFPAQDAIRLTLLSFIFACRDRKVSDELVIMVRPEVFKELDRLELQAFLTSLKAS
jgi:Domain of unknown function (DUF6430)